ncbi:MAG: gamma-glutamylcyclotransferase [Novosphingobium sp.]|nr:gamma-glutamylcyclotransferase [Novosphingobium sp.]
MRRAWFFFYGTLTEDHDNPVARRIAPIMQHGLRATVAGSLRAVRCAHGWYPVLGSGAGRVAGRLYRAGTQFCARDLRRMDAYEAFDPRRKGRSEYVRRPLRVRILRKGWVMAQVYVCNRPVHAGLPIIAGGDFAAFLKRRGLRAFNPGERADRPRKPRSPELPTDAPP